MPDRKPRLWYVLVAAFYPVISLGLSNRAELTSPAEIVLPLAGAALFGLFAWGAAGVLLKEVHRRGLIALVWIVWFSGYGYVVDALLHVPGFGGVHDPEVALPLTALISLAISLQITRQRHPLPNVTRFLNRVALILVALVGGSSLLAVAESRGHTSIPVGVQSIHRTGSSANLYLIVLDGYTGTTSLLKSYGFDNTPFLDSLRDLGFVVPQRAHSNYAATFLTLSSMLNWTYLDTISQELGAASRDRRIPYEMIERNRVVAFLKSRGYRFVFFPTAYRPTARSPEADQVIPGENDPEHQTRGELAAVWFSRTPLFPASVLACSALRCSGSPFPIYLETAELIKWKIDKLGGLAGTSSSSFVFAHILAPHEPFRFRADCSPRPPYLPLRTGPGEDPRVRAWYIDQIRCVNAMVLRLARRLIQESKTPPIILFQADHGNGRFALGQPPPLERLDSDQVSERFDIFAAYYLPGGGDSVIYDSITPVNVFPAVLNYYFAASLPRLPDRSYYSAVSRPYGFTRIY